jgi:hypothetical protein
MDLSDTNKFIERCNNPENLAYKTYAECNNCETCKNNYRCFLVCSNIHSKTIWSHPDNPLNTVMSVILTEAAIKQIGNYWKYCEKHDPKWIDDILAPGLIPPHLRDI